jgi:hypothetical protein
MSAVIVRPGSAMRARNGVEAIFAETAAASPSEKSIRSMPGMRAVIELRDASSSRLT